MRSGISVLVILWRRGLYGAVLLLLGLVLVACAGSSDPFGKSGPTTTVPPKGKTPPPIILQSMTGIPPQLARQFKTTLAVSAGQHDIGLVEGDLPGGTYKLAGVFNATPDAGGARIGFQWTLRDTAGVVSDQFGGDEPVPGASGADPWSAVTPAVLQRMADQTAQSLAIKLAARGFATRVSALVTPPTETFAMAGPGASTDIDYETLNGPGAVDPALVQEMPADVAATPPQDMAAAVTDGSTNDGVEADAAPGTVIKAVAVIPVKGAPGSGNDELTRAMRQTLAAAGWPVLTSPRADALTISGAVKLAGPQGATQTVSVSWVVSHPGGATLGDIKQSNDVPAGSLQQGFGAAATAVAEAAATGIFDLIRKYR
jgi:hypothetical protein